MEELDPTAREALRRYHDEVGLGAAARVRVRRRLAASLAREADQARAPARRQWVAAAVLLGSLAAAVVLMVCGVQGRLGERRTELEAAPYVAPQPPSGRAQPRNSESAAAPAPALPTIDPPPPAPTRPAPTRAAPPRRADDLAAELELLRRARSALDGGDPATALALVEDHARAFSAGQMRQDRDLLRVEALCARGDAGAARAAARAFLRDHPGSPLAARAGAICTGAPNVVTDGDPGGQPP